MKLAKTAHFFGNVKYLNAYLTVLRNIRRGYRKINGYITSLAGAKVDKKFVIRVSYGSVKVEVALSVIARHTAFGIEGYGKSIQNLVRGVLNLNGEAHITVRVTVGIHVAYIACKLHSGRAYKVYGYRAQLCAYVGVHAVIEGYRLGALSVGRSAAHIVIHGKGAVCGKIFLIIGVGEVKVVFNIGTYVIIVYGGRKTVPMSEGDLFGYHGNAAYGGVYRISSDRGSHLVIISEEIVAVLTARKGLLGLNGGVAAVSLTRHIYGVVLMTESSIHKHTCLKLINSLAADVLSAYGNVDHTVLIVVNRKKCYLLGKFDAVYSPYCGNSGVINLGNGDCTCFYTHMAVVSAEHVLGGGGTSLHPEGGEGGVIIFIGIQQILVVIGFVKLVAFDGVHKEAAVALGDLYAEIPVTELVVSRFCTGRQKVIQKCFRGKTYKQNSYEQQGCCPFDYRIDITLHNKLTSCLSPIPHRSGFCSNHGPE